MDFSAFQDLWKEIVAFFDRVIGWLNYVFNGEDDPYIYDKFPSNKYDD